MVERRRVVDQDVEAPELLPDLLEDFTNLLAIGDVHLDGEGLASHLAYFFRCRIRMDPALRHGHLRENALRCLSRFLEVGVVLDQDVGDDDVRAGLSESQRILAAQAA